MLLGLLNERTALTAEEAVLELDRRIDLPRADALDLLERNAELGLVAYRAADPDPTATLTQEGVARYAAMYRHSREITDSVYEGIDPEQIETVISVMIAVERRASELLAG
jgi:hypothetical protein